MTGVPCIDHRPQPFERPRLSLAYPFGRLAGACRDLDHALTAHEAAVQQFPIAPREASHGAAHRIALLLCHELLERARIIGAQLDVLVRALLARALAETEGIGDHMPGDPVYERAERDAGRNASTPYSFHRAGEGFLHGIARVVGIGEGAGGDDLQATGNGGWQVPEDNFVRTGVWGQEPFLTYPMLRATVFL